jgi:hypothetical protein
MLRVYYKTLASLLLYTAFLFPLQAKAERIMLVCPSIISQKVILSFILDVGRNVVLSAKLTDQIHYHDDVIFENIPLTFTDSEINWKWTWKLHHTNYYELDRNTLELKTWSDFPSSDRLWFEERTASLSLCRLERRQL